jgi:hypothetical protein
MLDFDHKPFADWICSIRPEYVWLGFNSKPGSVALSEPTPEEVQKFAGLLRKEGIEIRGKQLRGLVI